MALNGKSQIRPISLTVTILLVLHVLAVGVRDYAHRPHGPVQQLPMNVRGMAAKLTHDYQELTPIGAVPPKDPSVIAAVDMDQVGDHWRPGEDAPIPSVISAGSRLNVNTDRLQRLAKRYTRGLMPERRSIDTPENDRRSLLSDARRRGVAQLMKDADVSLEHKSSSESDVDRSRFGLQRAGLRPLAKGPSREGSYRKFPEQEQAIERIVRSLQKTDDAAERDSLKLPLAAAFVGRGQWEIAKEMYRKLAESAVHESIRETALRNLTILMGRSSTTVQGCGCPEPEDGTPSSEGGTQ